MKLVSITEKVYGRTHFASPEDLTAVRTGKRRMLPLRSKNGRRFSDLPFNLQPDGGTCLHPDYLTGAALSEFESTP